MATYTTIRSKAQEARCARRGPYGSPLCCECGCQRPHSGDPNLDAALAGIKVGHKADEGYANVELRRGRKYAGNINTQYSCISLAGVEYLGCTGIDDLLTTARAVLAASPDDSGPVGDSLEETAMHERIAEAADLADQDARNAGEDGYCPKCHTYCYGDCDAHAL